MASVAVDVSGDMELPPDEATKNQFARLMQFSTQLPDAKEWINVRRQNVRPWLDFVKTSNFRIPQSVPRLSRRIMKNIEYFQSNYLFVFLGLFIYCLITSPLLLFALAGSFYVGYRLSKRHNERRFVLFGHELTLAQVYGLVSLVSMPIFYLVGAGAAMFWVLGASFFIITLHASFYNIDALVSEDEESLSFMPMEEV